MFLVILLREKAQSLFFVGLHGEHFVTENFAMSVREAKREWQDE